MFTPVPVMFMLCFFPHSYSGYGTKTSGGKAVRKWIKRIKHAGQLPLPMQLWESLAVILSEGDTVNEALLHTHRKAYEVSFGRVLAYTGFVVLCVAIGVVVARAWLMMVQ
jgi:hypothetical protein